MKLLHWIWKFAIRYKYGSKEPTKYDQSLNANIQHAMKQVHELKIPPKMVNDFIQELRNQSKNYISPYYVRSVLNEYFINTYVPFSAYK